MENFIVYRAAFKETATHAPQTELARATDAF